MTADPEQPGAHPLILALVDYDRLVAPAPNWPGGRRRCGPAIAGPTRTHGGAEHRTSPR